MNKEFKVLPNGFESWAETHHEVVAEITRQQSLCREGVVETRLEQQGIGGLYELGIELTDKFEAIHEGRNWDWEWLETIERFLEEELS